ncbi:MAG: hypothetical protein LH609_11075 [Rudanella sp.]|nr:hypothetical protein [Rudanella sp.]
MARLSIISIPQHALSQKDETIRVLQEQVHHLKEVNTDLRDRLAGHLQGG